MHEIENVGCSFILFGSFIMNILPNSIIHIHSAFPFNNCAIQFFWIFPRLICKYTKKISMILPLYFCITLQRRIAQLKVRCKPHLCNSNTVLNWTSIRSKKSLWLFLTTRNNLMDLRGFDLSKSLLIYTLEKLAIQWLRNN